MSEGIHVAINRLYESGYERELWLDSLDRFCLEFNIQGAITVPRIAAENTLNLPFSPSLMHMANQFVSDGWYKNDMRADRGWPMVDAGHPVVLEQDIISPEEQMRMGIYNDLYRPHDLLWWAGVTFKTKERQYTVSMLRRPDQGAFSEDERRLFLQVRHYLSKAMSIAETMSTSAARGSVDVLHALGHAAILIDGWGRVRACTPRAEALLGPELSITGNRFIATHGETNRQLQAMIRRTVLDTPLPDAPLRVQRFYRRPVVIDVLPIPASSRMDFLFSHALVLLVDLDEQPLSNIARLRIVFSLTPNEARLAGHLVTGYSLAEAADAMGVGHETARSHLKGLFVKTATHRQGQLIAVLSRVSQMGSIQ
ncbi:helix-turn-helix transcriptional regulator [Pelagibacterium sediminicola]|uniref:helix-turn-helix transcriptional regulator n=1 Tax=Pelagibacterium sediminicola TaxID=2248761 RepID=UPI001300B1D2|nr:helix-turn-helix transcriptional regulator [Pelagibacterium sediminicola]